MGLFTKKQCDICGGDIGLLGNRKLEDGNMCKNCAKLLSPWFSERRRSTVADIREQLDYREANRARVAAFRTTRTLGDRTRVLLDENAGVFMVTSERNLEEANPDVMAFSDVTGCDLDIRENRTEIKRQGPDGRRISYNPPRFTYRYDFEIIINVSNPYFDEISFKLNNSSVTMETQAPSMGGRYFSGPVIGHDPEYSPEYRRYREMGEEIRDTLLYARQSARGAVSAQYPTQSPSPSPAQAAARTMISAAASAQTGTPWFCPACGGHNSGRFCENCGRPRSQ